jgi:hypothetical protein
MAHPETALAKYVPPPSEDQISSLKRLSELQFQTFNETDVREEFLVPLIALLGYQRNSDYSVLREESYNLHPLFLTVGSSRIKLDYKFNVYKAGFWLLEAKGAVCVDPAQPPPITDKIIDQAHFYAHHRDIDCPLFGVSNGWWTNLYDRDAEDPGQPIFSVFHSDLPTKFGELSALLGASQVTFWIKRRLLTRIEQVLSADVDLARTDEFVRAAQTAAHRARPKVLENFRRVAEVRQETQNRAFRDYLENSRSFDMIDTLLMSPLSLGHSNLASDVLSRKVAQFPGSNQFLFFHKLTVKDPRVVTIGYYINALNLLGTFCYKRDLEKVDTFGGGKAETPIVDIYFGFARLLLFHFSARPDLQVIWAMEGLLSRMVKRALLSNRTARTSIAVGVEMQRYFQSEEEIAYMGPSPARTLAQVVEGVTLAELGAFFSRYCDKERNRGFDVRGAVEEFQQRHTTFERLEGATDAAYRELVKSLGQEWSEMTWIDHLNRTWDRLGHAACEIIFLHRTLLQFMPDDCRLQMVELARLGNSWARKCAEELGMTVPIEYPDASARMKVLFALSGTH